MDTVRRLLLLRLGQFFFRYRNQVFPLIGCFILFETWPVFSDENFATIARWIGLIVAIIGLIIRALTVGLTPIARTGKRKVVYADSLIQEGMFAHSRNPLYWGNLHIAIGVGLVSNSLLFIAISIPILLVVYRSIVCVEEDFLSRQFGALYSDYCKRVNRFVPRLKGFATMLCGMNFLWLNVVLTEDALCYETLAGIVLLTLKHYIIHNGFQMDLKIYGLLLLLGALTIVFLVIRVIKKKRRRIARVVPFKP